MLQQTDQSNNEMLLMEQLVAQFNENELSNVNGMEEHIFNQLNQLRLWRDTQEQKLESNQLTQRELLNLEKEKLYELLGLTLSSDQSEGTNDDEYSTEDESETEAHYDVNLVDPNNDDKDDERDCETDDDEESNTPRTEIEMPIKTRPISPPLPKPKIPPSVPEYSKTDATTAPIQKRPFLKRGEGLKNRFKISPDTFRLDNLPKYKYAQRVAQALSKRQPVNQKKQRQQQQQCHDVRGVEGQTNNNNFRDKTPKVDDVNKISSEKFKKSGSGCLKLKPRKLLNASELNADILIDSKKLNINDVHERTEENASNTKWRDQLIPDIVGNPSTTPLFDTPIRNKVHEQRESINELNLFEFLERRLANSTAESTPIIKNSVQNMADNKNASDPTKCFRTASIRPARCAVSQRSDRRAKEMAAEAETAREQDQTSFYSSDEEPRHVHFASHAVKYVGPEDSISMTELEEVTVNDYHAEGNGNLTQEPSTNFAPTDEQSTDSFQRFKDKLFDRKLKQKFKNQLTVARNTELVELDEDVDSISINSNQSSNYEPTSAQMESHPILAADLQAKNELLQNRLAELESEIASFKEQNSELTKLIREHEVMRLEFEEERNNTQEQLNDERIKIEVYLHDENMKLVNERKELDRKAKEIQKPSRSERDEIAKLREQCANHEKELCARDQKHVAAQARIRAQLRNVEKELKEAQFEVENVRKENKKLESENARLRRQGNNKMLQEINRNIAKLAPLQLQNGENLVNNNDDANRAAESKSNKLAKSKSVSIPHGAKDCSNKSAHRSVVAKVTHSRSGTPSNSTTNRIRSKSVPNLQQSIDSYSSPNFSDGEIDNGSDSDSPDANGHTKSNYFCSSTSVKSRTSRSRSSVTEHKSRSPSAAHNNSNGSNQSSNYKRVIENHDGSKDVWYPNGNLKKISPDGMCIRMLYYNKDIKETNIAEGTVKYYYAESNTWHTSYIDGLEILEFPNGQTEHRFKDGTIEVHFPNGSVRITNPYKEKNDGIREEWKYPDGTNVIQKTNGDKLLLLPNGQREVHTNGHKRREYPDGTVKIVYPDGSQESRYSNGRVRLKDKDGKLVMDSETIFV